MSDIVAYGSVTGGSAGGTVSTTASLTAGHYRTTVTTWTTGTITSADGGNVQLQAGAGTVSALGMVATAGVPFVSAPTVVDVGAASALLVTLVGNASGTAAAYHASIVASPIALFE